MAGSSREVKEFYAQWSRDYDRHMTETYHYKALHRALKKVSGSVTGRMLDMACGTGEALRYLLEEQNWDRPPSEIFANDFSPHMLEHARGRIPRLQFLWNFLADIDFSFPFSQGTRLADRLRDIRLRRKTYSPEVTFTSSDAADTGFPDGYFDTVLVSYGFHWFREKERVAGEARRVLRPGGRLVSIEEYPLVITPSSTMNQYGRDLLANITTIPLDDLYGMLEDAGFRQTQRSEETIHARGNPHHMTAAVFER